jgi:hypothetical protein
MAHAPGKRTSAAMRSCPRVSVMVGGLVDDGAARTCHPDSIVLDATLERAAVLMLEDEGFERDAEGGGHRQPLRTPGVSQRESRLAWPRCPRA